MNPYEEELQKNFEQGNDKSGEEADIKAYQYVFDALKKEPPITLHPDFASGVINKVLEKKEKRGLSGDFLWFGVGIFLIVIAAIVAIAFSGFKPSLGFLSGLTSFKGLLVFAAIFITALNWLDKKLIHKKQASI
jgi:hypothetical protein